MISPVNKNCPICGGYVYSTDIGTEICQTCGHVIAQSTFATTSTSYTYASTSAADKYCYNCNTKMEKIGDGGWWECPNCHYGCMDYIGDLPKELTEEEIEISKHIFGNSLHIPCDNNGLAVGKISNEDLLSNTLQFDRCKKIIFRDKTLDFVFEIPDERYKDIDTIIVNGHKFTKEKSK